MTIDNTTIDKLAKLSSLTIDESKKESLGKELEDIVTFVENLNYLYCSFWLIFLYLEEVWIILYLNLNCIDV